MMKKAKCFPALLQGLIHSSDHFQLFCVSLVTFFSFLLDNLLCGCALIWNICSGYRHLVSPHSCFLGSISSLFYFIPFLSCWELGHGWESFWSLPHLTIYFSLSEPGNLALNFYLEFEVIFLRSIMDDVKSNVIHIPDPGGFFVIVCPPGIFYGLYF